MQKSYRLWISILASIVLHTALGWLFILTPHKTIFSKSNELPSANSALYWLSAKQIPSYLAATSKPHSKAKQVKDETNHVSKIKESWNERYIKEQATIVAIPVTESSLSSASTSVTNFEKAKTSHENDVFQSQIIPPIPLDRPKPLYPFFSRQKGEEGIVLLQIEIDQAGKVSEVRLKQSSGYNRLDQSALNTVRNWRFLPARKNNQAVTYRYVQKIPFELRYSNSN